MKMAAVFWDVAPCSLVETEVFAAFVIRAVMEAVSTFEMSL
jgi:hypothetical protein